ncbi:chlorophyll a-b binding protein 8 [Musa troglodytarum]|uniref:Chlorophyll a-b binding protein 8 n=1 Tax=Musa troglodytarum TaxID=320322 RepID=A0A9E7HG88_9LILI|nr:chlorophyll a-b binding protein 8 [Musa troglodytarum]
MLGAAGAIAPETLGKLGMRPAETALPWFKTGVTPPAGTCAYRADPYTLFGAHGVCGAQEGWRRGWVGQETLLPLEDLPSTLLALGRMTSHSRS